MQLRITLTIEVPDGLFEQADTIAKIQKPLSDFSHALSSVGVESNMEHKLTEAPKPVVYRAPRADKGTKRIAKVVPGAPASQSLGEAAE